MSERRVTVDDAELERSLVGLGRNLQYPPTPPIAVMVRSHLETETRPFRIAFPRLLRTRAFGLGALAVVLFAATVLAASPAARAAVSEWLGIPGVRIMVGGTEPRRGQESRDVGLGQLVTLADARSRVSFHILIPTIPGLRRPNKMYLATYPPGGRVSLVYKVGPGLPPTRRADVGLLLTEFRARDDQVFFGKMVGWKALPQGMRVAADHGYWIAGDHLTFMYRTVTGHQVVTNVRPAGSTLLWQHDGLTLRLESALPKRAAMRIATSMR